ncbi:peptidase M55 D-aminopeptidase [Aminomonas paucivorans DSM 12260]|uniref:Peptidase M55 D-aminopeptidase n=1 Tax=Aminomonas paucivorans DSM 12260 TaxID=584708 RepID=E3CVZ9_9BACT|nr:M55 family metallopeptidase [Aminomonas paucivorans]EFQ24254.1 peptidase M55 D-aminopeptidase [Aminomonas paucivorans DSM 12260]
MRIFISADMEGCTGIVRPCQVDAGTEEYALGRAMMLHDVRTVAETLLREGCSVVVADSHDRMINLEARDLPEEVELISGTPRVLGMVEGAQGCDGAFFVGYHAMAGTEKAVLDHTMSTGAIHEVRLGGRLVGETGLNAFLCGALGVPVALVTGDEAVGYEASALLGEDLVTCAVKEGLGRFSARLLTPEAAADRLSEAVGEAVGRLGAGRLSCWTPPGPYRLDVRFQCTYQADGASLVPGGERMDGRTLRFVTPDPLEIRRWFEGALTSALSVRADG